MFSLFQRLMRMSRDLTVFGINIPTTKDPKTGKGSVSLTLVYVSATLVVLGIFGEWSGKFGDIDVGEALQFFYACSALYWARKLPSSWTGSSTPKEAPSKVDNPDA